MTRPLRIQFDGAYYHVTSRGNERKNVFRNNRDREQFLSYLKSAHYRYKAVFHVFCLMNNHYHYLLETPKGNLSQIMHHINGAYTNYFNIKHRRREHLFQGRYKAIVVDADSYAGELSRYIHLNPVRAGLIDVLKNLNGQVIVFILVEIKSLNGSVQISYQVILRVRKKFLKKDIRILFMQKCICDMNHR